MPVEMPSTDPEIWRTHDAQWMAARVEEWRNVLHRLREPRLRIKRPQMQQLKSYFFTGAHCPVKEKMTFGTGIAKMYVWWLHPQEPEQFLFDPHENGHLNRIRDMFRKFLETLSRKSKELNGETYGTMGGRELSLMRALNPGLDWRVPHKLGGIGNGNLKLGRGRVLESKRYS